MIVINVREFDGERIDKYLSNSLDISRSKIEKLILNKEIKVNDKEISKSYIVKIDDEIVINEDFKEKETLEKEDIPLDIIYEDEYLAVINKKSGMVVHPGAGNTNHTLVNALLFHFDKLSNNDIRPGIVHRLDKDTSGLMIVAKNDDVHLKLASDFKNKKIIKKYLALVDKKFNHKTGTIDAPIGRDIKNRKKMTVTDLNSKDAITHFEVLETYKDTSLIECTLETGRTHQIRVHLNYINHPLINDSVYGSRIVDLEFGQMLHSYSLEFNHPITNEFMSFKVEPPKKFIVILNTFKNN